MIEYTTHLGKCQPASALSSSGADPVVSRIEHARFPIPFYKWDRNRHLGRERYMCYIYILESLKSGKYYVGCTSREVKIRLVEHNKGLSRYTKGDRPWCLRYFEQYDDLSQARQREKQIKSWKKRKAIERLFKRPHRLVV